MHPPCKSPWVILPALLVTASTAWAQTSLDYTQYLHFQSSVPGVSYAGPAVTAGNCVIFTEGPGQLRILDLSDPSSPADLGALAIEGEILHLASGTAGAEGPPLLLIDVAGEGLRVYGLADPASPSLESVIAPPAGIRLLAVDGPSAAMITEDDRCRLFDLAQPDQPAALGDVPATR